MRKPKQGREAHNPSIPLVNPLFAMTDALLKGGEKVLDSMEEVAKNAGAMRVSVIPTADAPKKRRARSGSNSRKRKAKSKRR